LWILLVRVQSSSVSRLMTVLTSTILWDFSSALLWMLFLSSNPVTIFIIILYWLFYCSEGITLLLHN
jgi:hypothetical protein